MANLLMTGAIGSGKTAHAVHALLTRDDLKGRPIFHHGINWTPGNDPGQRVYCEDASCLVCPNDPGHKTGLKATDWHLWSEPNAILFYDECHYIWPKRDPKRAPPAGVASITQMRHRKVDMIVLTPHPMFLDIDVRRLMNEHWHFLQHGLGRKCYYFNPYSDDPLDTRGAEVEMTRLPKSIFGQYVSSEAGHSKFRRKVPRKFAIALIWIALLFGSVFFTLPDAGSFLSVTEAEVEPVEPLPALDVDQGVQVSRVRPAGGGLLAGLGGRGLEPVLTREDYVELLDPVPVVPGWPETAPKYSHLVQEIRPTEVPVLSACAKRSGEQRCFCYDQHARPYPTTLSRCEAFLDRRDGIPMPERYSRVP